MSAQDDRDGVDATPVTRATLEDLLRIWRRSIELELRVSAPARVVTYDAATQRATVQLEFLPVAYVGDDEVPQAPILIPGAAVRWLGGSLGYVTTPLVPGDTGHVVFSDRCLSVWLQQGAPVDPLNSRTHDLADAVFEPGLRNSTNAITPPTDLTATVVEGPLVKLGATAQAGTGAIALAQALHTYLVAVITAGVPTATDGGANLKATMLAYLGANPFTSFATTKVVAV